MGGGGEGARMMEAVIMGDDGVTSTVTPRAEDASAALAKERALFALSEADWVG